MDLQVLERAKEIQNLVKNLTEFNEVLANYYAESNMLKIVTKFPNTSLDGRELTVEPALATVIQNYITSRIAELNHELAEL